jgi:hypothetical protein
MKWEDSIKMGVEETGCEDGRWKELAQDRIQQRALILIWLIIRYLLPESAAYRPVVTKTSLSF